MEVGRLLSVKIAIGGLEDRCYFLCCYLHQIASSYEVLSVIYLITIFTSFMTTIQIIKICSSIIV